MNPKDYVGKAITLKQIAMRRDINVDTAVSFVLSPTLMRRTLSE